MTDDVSRHEPAEEGTSALDRIVFFSDAVFAIAITLLVLPITVPASGDHLGAALRDLWPKFFSFLLSFGVVGLFWIAHHRYFRYIVRFDEGLLALNMLLLLCIAFLPFPSALLGEHGDETVATVFYALYISVTGLVAVSLWWYAAAGRRLLGPAIDRPRVRYLVLRGLAVPAAFLPSVPVAFASPTAAEWMWLLIPLLQAAARLAR